MEPTRLWINLKYSWLACSPDGLIKDNEGDGVLEIKWIANKKFRNESVLKYVKESKTGCLNIKDNGELELKKNHNYYFQIQGQLFVTQRKFCDFAIFTENDQFIQRIYYDKSFFYEKCYTKLKQFYFLSYLPEYILRNHRKKKDILDFTP